MRLSIHAAAAAARLALGIAAIVVVGCSDEAAEVRSASDPPRADTAPRVDAVAPEPSAPSSAAAVVPTAPAVVAVELPPLPSMVASPADERARGLRLDLEAVVPPAEGSGLRSVDVRRSRLLALHVPPATPASAFLAPGPFRARWSGELVVSRRDRYRFGYTGRGTFRLEVAGEVVLEATGAQREPLVSEPVRLKKGAHPVVASYTAPITGSASVRVFWAGRKFALEPVPPEAWQHDPAAEDLRYADLRRRGRELVASRQCGACHAGLERTATAMPELASTAPSLADAGRRLREPWVAQWIADPRVFRPDAHQRMPRVALGDDRAAGARDVAAWLATLGESLDAASPGDATTGAALFRDLGCIACHGLDDASRAPNAVVVPMPLDHVDAKFAPGALAAFLADPRAHDPWGRMPDFGLSDDEARALAAFLRGKARPAAGAAAPDSAGSVERGRALARASGCVSCHGGTGEESALDAPAWATVIASGFDRGCVGDDAESRGRAPDFGFGEVELAALRTLRAAGFGALQRTCASELADRQVGSRQCAACHRHDGASAWWTGRESLLDELGVPPRPIAENDSEVAQNRPALTWLGEKLTHDALQSMLRDGTGDASPRPWLHARMPAVPAPLVPALAAGLAYQHGVPLASSAPRAIDADRARAGETLVSAAGGFGCVTCHAIGSNAATAVFEVQGINFARSVARLREDYYRRWMRDPDRIDASAKMPKYAADDGTTALTEFFDGDAEQQFDAIWQWLRTLSKD